MSQNKADRCVAVAGFGAIGTRVAEALDAGIGGLRLTAVSARDRAKAEGKMIGFRNPVPVVALEEIAQQAEIVVECLPARHFAPLAEQVLGGGGTLVALSVGALLPRPDLIDLATRSGGTIVVPTGALLGLDAVRAAAEGELQEVRLITRKPPMGLEGAPYLEAKGITLKGLTKPLKVFEGTARDGAQGFPANVNVAAALSLAGLGPDRTSLEIWADPTITRNTHRVEVTADSAHFSMTIENVPSEENPRSGKITALSVIATLRRMVSPLAVGT